MREADSPTRQAFIAGNWKMHKTRAEAASLVRELIPAVKASSGKIMVAPPFTALATVGELLKGTNILLGAQNMGQEEAGAHTGEVSVLMLRDLGVDIVILGHSERRHTYGETDELINRKVRLALAHGLEVILCVGETLDQRERGVTQEVVGSQVRKGLAEVGSELIGRVTIAYEPVWAIGTGRNATPEDADAIHAEIREIIEELYDAGRAGRMTVQYGGSVKPKNIRELMAMQNIDGALVGGASLEASTFVPIVCYNDKV